MYYKSTINSFFAILLSIALSACSDSNDPAPTPPGGKTVNAPQNLTAVPSDQTVTLEWDEVAGATYNLYMGTSSGVTTDSNSALNFMQHTNVTNPFTHIGLTNDTTYYFVITAVVNGIESDISTEVSATPFIPDTPINVTAVAGDQVITLAWDEVAGATYNLYMGTSSGVSTDSNSALNFMQHINITNPFTHTGLTNGTTYYFVITAVVNGIESDISTEVAATPFIPQAPQNVSALAAVNAITLSWVDNNSNPNASYNIYMGTSSGVNTDPNSTTNYMVHSNVTNPFIHTGLSSNTIYYFVVTVSIDGVESPVSTEVSMTPLPLLAPQNVSAVASNQAVRLQWDNISNASYTIYMGTSSGVTKDPNSSQGFMQHTNVTNPFTHTGLVNGTTYYFVVSATVDGIESVISQEVSTAPLPGVLNPPQLSNTATTESSATLNWPAINGASSYNVYRATVSGINQTNYSTIAGGKLYAAVAAPPFTDDNDAAGLANGTTYYYVVTAVNAISQSTESNEVAATTLTPIPAAPSTLTAPTIDIRQVQLTWADNSNNESGFRIERQELLSGGGYSPWGTPNWSVGANITTWADTTVTPGKSYQYRVIAFNAGGDSATWSNVLPVAVPLPNAPAQLSATAASFNNVPLSWVDTNNPSDGFSLERAEDTTPTTWAPIWTNTTNMLSYSDTSVVAGTTYLYRIKALVNGIPSLASEPPVTVLVPDSIPMAPTNLALDASASLSYSQVPLQ